MSRRPARCTVADIARIMKAAQQCGIPHRVELMKDGTLKAIPIGPEALVSSLIAAKESDHAIIL